MSFYAKCHPEIVEIKVLQFIVKGSIKKSVCWWLVNTSSWKSNCQIEKCLISGFCKTQYMYCKLPYRNLWCVACLSSHCSCVSPLSSCSPSPLRYRNPHCPPLVPPMSTCCLPRSDSSLPVLCLGLLGPTSKIAYTCRFKLWWICLITFEIPRLPSAHVQIWWSYNSYLKD